MSHIFIRRQYIFRCKITYNLLTRRCFSSRLPTSSSPLAFLSMPLQIYMLICVHMAPRVKRDYAVKWDCGVWCAWKTLKFCGNFHRSANVTYVARKKETHKVFFHIFSWIFEPFEKIVACFWHAKRHCLSTRRQNDEQKEKNTSQREEKEKIIGLI